MVLLKRLKFLLGAIILLQSLPYTLNAQQEACGNGRFLDSLFEVKDPVKLKYGQNKTYTGKDIELFMDVYEPQDDDAAKRPLLFFLFGGSFIGGNKSNVEPHCRYFAERGYVCAAIDYRLIDQLIPLPDSLVMMDAAVKATGDLKAAIRYFRQDAATSNQFKIDTGYIVVGGLSSGGITCLHTAYLDNEDDIPSFVDKIIEENGGLEGNSGDSENLKYSSKVHGVINYYGGIYKESWLNNNNQPVVSIHGDKDDIVPFGRGIAGIKIGNQTAGGVTLNGSKIVHEKADELKIPNQLIVVPDGGHGNFDQVWLDSMYNTSTIFHHNNLICPTNIGIEDVDAHDVFKAYPNPTSEYLILEFDNMVPETVQLLDLFGRVLLTESIIENKLRLNTFKLPMGLYSIRFKIDKNTPFKYDKNLIIKR